MAITLLPRPVKSWQKLSIAFGVLSFVLASPTIAQAQETMRQMLTVTGEATEMIPTTKAEVQLGVEIRGETAQQVQEEVARRTTAVVELLRSRNVEKLETTGVRLNPVYDYRNDEQRLTGYVGTNTVSFRLNTTQVGQLLDSTVQAGATRIDNIRFIAEDSAIAIAQKQALREATQDALSQADAVLDSLNLTRQEIVGIQLNGAYAPPPEPIPLQRVTMAKLESDVSTPVIGGEQTVRASVTLQIGYE